MTRTNDNADSGGSSLENTKKRIRREMRAARRALPKIQQDAHKILIAEQIQRMDIFKNAQHIAAYVANDGEVCLDPLLAFAIAEGKHCYLPRVTGKDMHFHRYRANEPLLKNKFGIPEPSVSSDVIAASRLDLVCLPLVAYDCEGRRLGMGGGYYDRCFAFKKELAVHATSPVLLGVAHAIQEHGTLPQQSWDIALDYIVNEHRCITLNHAAPITGKL